MTTQPVSAHSRPNHDGRRYGQSSYSEQTGTNTSSETVSIPASLVEQQQAQENQTAGMAENVQEYVPHRPLGL